MTAGVEAFSPSGVSIYAVTDKIGKVIGTFDTGTSNGSFSVTALSGRRAFFIKTQQTFGGRDYHLYTATISISSSGLISWTFVNSGHPSNINSAVVYGYY